MRDTLTVPNSLGPLADYTKSSYHPRSYDSGELIISQESQKHRHTLINCNSGHNYPDRSDLGQQITAVAWKSPSQLCGHQVFEVTPPFSRLTVPHFNAYFNILCFGWVF